MASSAVSHNHSGQLLHPPPAGSMMARLDRLDLVVGYLEEMRHGSARSSTSPSTPTTFSSSSPTTPRSAQSRCRPAEELLRETRAKGSLVERIGFLENRILRMEEERLSSMSMEITPERRLDMDGRLSSSMSRLIACPNTEHFFDRLRLAPPIPKSWLRPWSSAGAGGSGTGSGRKKKGLKSLVKSCVNRAGGKLKTKD